MENLQTIKEAFEKTNAALEKLSIKASVLLESSEKTVQIYEDIFELARKVK